MCCTTANGGRCFFFEYMKNYSIGKIFPTQCPGVTECADGTWTDRPADAPRLCMRHGGPRFPIPKPEKVKVPRPLRPKAAAPVVVPSAPIVPPAPPTLFDAPAPVVPTIAPQEKINLSKLTLLEFSQAVKSAPAGWWVDFGTFQKDDLSVYFASVLKNDKGYIVVNSDGLRVFGRPDIAYAAGDKNYHYRIFKAPSEAVKYINQVFVENPSPNPIGTTWRPYPEWNKPKEAAPIEFPKAKPRPIIESYPPAMLPIIGGDLSAFAKARSEEIYNPLSENDKAAVFNGIFINNSPMSVQTASRIFDACPWDQDSIFIFSRPAGNPSEEPDVTDLHWPDFKSEPMRAEYPKWWQGAKFDIIPVTKGATKKDAATAANLFQKAIKNKSFAAIEGGFSLWIVATSGTSARAYLAIGDRPTGSVSLFNISLSTAPILEALPSVVPQTMAKNDPPLSEIRSEDIEKIEGQYHATQTVKKLIRESFDSGLLKNYTVTSSKRIRLEFQQPKNGVVEVLVSKMETDANNFVNPKKRRYQKVFVYLKKRF